MAQQRVCDLIRMKPPTLDNRGLLWGSGDTLPSDGTDGYQRGAIFMHTGASSGSPVCYINEGSITSSSFQPVEAGDYGTFSSLTAGSGIVLSSDNTENFAAYADDNGANIGCSVRNILGRTLLTVDQSAGSIRSVMGQLKLADGVDVATGIYTGVQGYVELAGDHSAQSGATFSCFDASLEIASGKTLTVDSGGEACGIHVETTGSGSISNSGTCAAILIQNASGAPDWPTGVHVDGPSVTRAARFGQFASGAATTSAVLFATAGDVYSDGQLSAVEIHGASSGNLGSGYSAKCLRARHVVNASAATVEHETYGVMGQLVVRNTTLGHLHAGVVGTLEGHTSGVTVNQATYDVACAAVMARIGGQGAITATDPVAGFLAFYNAAALASGSAYAFATDTVSGSYLWTVGLAITDSSCTTGIAIGTCTTGMTITGATGYAIDIATSGVFRMGVQDTGVDLTTTYPFAIDVQCEANADITAGSTGSSAGIYARYAIEAAQTSQCNHIAMFAKLRPKANLADGNHVGVYGLVEASGSTTIAGTSTTTTAAGLFALDFGSSMTVSTGHLNGIVVDSSINSSANISGATVSAVRIKKSGSSAAWPTGITLESGACDKLISGTCTMSGSSALNSIEITTTSATTHSSGYERSIYVSHTHQTSNATGSSEVNAIAADLQCTSNITQAYCFTAYTGSMAGATVNRVAHYAGYLDAITGTVNASSVAFFETVGGATYNSFIAVRRHGGTIHSIISDMSGGATANNFFEFSGANLPVASGDATGGAKTYKLACKVGGATKYIQLYDS